MNVAHKPNSINNDNDEPASTAAAAAAAAASGSSFKKSILSRSITTSGAAAGTSSSSSSHRSTKRKKLTRSFNINEYNHHVEKHLHHQNTHDYVIPHDSFLKKFSTRTTVVNDLIASTHNTLFMNQSNSNLPYFNEKKASDSMLAMAAAAAADANANANIADANSKKDSSQYGRKHSNRRCSFKLDTNREASVTESLLEKTSTAVKDEVVVDESSPGVASSSAISPSGTLDEDSNKQNQIVLQGKRKAGLKKSVSLTSSTNSCMSNMSNQMSLKEIYMKKILIKFNFFVIGPDDNTMFVWLIVLNVCIIYNLWLIIARQSFEKLQSMYAFYWRVADAIADSIYLIDVAVHFRTGYLEQGLLVYDSKKLAINYVKSKMFLLDLFSLMPFELFQLKYGYDVPMLRFPRFFKLYRTIELYYITESRTLYPNLWRVANLTHILFLLGHWFAGFYFLISQAEGFKGHWSYPEPVDEFALLPRMYLRCLYWSTLTLTTIGDLPPPETNWQWLKEMSNFRYLFSIAVHYLAVFVIALIVGQVGNVITNRNANRAEFERLLDGAKQYMRNHNVPTDMQKRVQRWYDYSWSRGRMNGAGDIHSIGLLPDKLKTELALHVNLETLRKVTIFQECQPEFLHDLVLKMRASIFTPGDVICRKGEIAREMFIIADGVLEVIGENGDVLTKMFSGDFFGEIGILNIEGASNKRTADVRSVGYAELFSLSKEDVLTAVKDYPEAERILIEYGKRRLNQNLAKQAASVSKMKEINESKAQRGSQLSVMTPSVSTSNLNAITNSPANGNTATGSVSVVVTPTAISTNFVKIENEEPFKSQFVDKTRLNPNHFAAIRRSKFEPDVELGDGVENRGLITDMLGLPTMANKQTEQISTSNTMELTKITEKEKELETELLKSNMAKCILTQKINSGLEELNNLCLRENVANAAFIMDKIKKLKDELCQSKDKRYEDFFDLIEQKDAKIKLLDSRIKILQKYLTQKDTV